MENGGDNGGKPKNVRYIRSSRSVEVTPQRLGVVLGGSGLVGGTIMNFFQKEVPNCQIFAPNSKRLNIREPKEIKAYFKRLRPDFIVNSALASLDSSAQMALDVNYTGAVDLAQIALEAKIPLIHLSSAATLPPGEGLMEDDELALTPDLANYPKSKLLAEKALRYMHREKGLDYTNIRLAVVYGKYDYKIQGFHRLLFSVVSGSMPFMMTSPGVCHSYSNAQKLPYFIKHILNHREEFSGETYHFVDHKPLEMATVIEHIKNAIGAKLPREVFLPYGLARMSAQFLQKFTRFLGRFGVESKMPAEMIFLKECYRTQSLSCRKLQESSFRDPSPESTLLTELPFLLEHYLTRWSQLNLISSEDQLSSSRTRLQHLMENPSTLLFMESPETLLDALRKEK